MLKLITRLALNKDYQKAQLNPNQIQYRQQKLWTQYWQQLQRTDLDRHFNISLFRNFEDFQSEFPILTYTDLEPFITTTLEGKTGGLFHEPLVKVGMTSGTTGKHGKKIPYNQSMLNQFYRGRAFNLSTILREHPNALKNPLYTLSLSAPAEVYKHQNIPYGYISGIVNEFEPFIMKGNFFPRQGQSTSNDWHQLITQIFEQTKSIDLKMLAGIPAVLAEMLESLCERYGVSNLKTVFPNLQYCVFGGTGISLFQSRIDAACGRPLKYFGTYVSTEAPIGLPVKSYDGESLYYLNPNIIVNFADPTESPRPMGVQNLKVGKTYQVLTTTPNGFLQYPIKDEIQVETVEPYFTFKILGRSQGGLNLATEKITEEKLDRAITELAKHSIEKEIQYFVAPYQNGKHIGYEFLLMLNAPNSVLNQMATALPIESQVLAQKLDEILSEQNQDYRESREREILGPVRTKVVSNHILANFFRQNNQRGQIKISKVFPSQERLADYLKNHLGYSIGKA